MACAKCASPMPACKQAPAGRQGGRVSGARQSPSEEEVTGRAQTLTPLPRAGPLATTGIQWWPHVGAHSPPTPAGPRVAQRAKRYPAAPAPRAQSAWPAPQTPLQRGCSGGEPQLRLVPAGSGEVLQPGHNVRKAAAALGLPAQRTARCTQVLSLLLSKAEHTEAWPIASTANA